MKQPFLWRFWRLISVQVWWEGTIGSKHIQLLKAFCFYHLERQNRNNTVTLAGLPWDIDSALLALPPPLTGLLCNFLGASTKNITHQRHTLPPPNHLLQLTWPSSISHLISWLNQFNACTFRRCPISFHFQQTSEGGTWLLPTCSLSATLLASNPSPSVLLTQWPFYCFCTSIFSDNPSLLEKSWWHALPTSFCHGIGTDPVENLE